MIISVTNVYFSAKMGEESLGSDKIVKYILNMDYFGLYMLRDTIF